MKVLHTHFYSDDPIDVPDLEITYEKKPSKNKKKRQQNLSFPQLSTIIKMPNLALAVEDVKMTMTTTKVFKSNYLSEDDFLMTAFSVHSKKASRLQLVARELSGHFQKEGQCNEFKCPVFKHPT